MVAKRSTALWKETTAIAKDLANEEQIAHRCSWWECDHYKVEVWNKDASRLPFHLSGDAGLRGAGSSFTSIEVFLRVPPDVADRARIEMAAKTANKVRKSSFSAAGRVMASEEGDLRAERIHRTLPHLSNKDAERI
jgi:hypothetical protein